MNSPSAFYHSGPCPREILLVPRSLHSPSCRPRQEMQSLSPELRGTELTRTRWPLAGQKTHPRCRERAPGCDLMSASANGMRRPSLTGNFCCPSRRRDCRNYLINRNDKCLYYSATFVRELAGKGRRGFCLWARSPHGTVIYRSTPLRKADRDGGAVIAELVVSTLVFYTSGIVTPSAKLYPVHVNTTAPLKNPSYNLGSLMGIQSNTKITSFARPVLTKSHGLENSL